jgi:radical SAM superfamily enzyme YgiQ (UPF0313 family)
LDPQVVRRRLLAEERGTIIREAPLKIALCYPNPYRTAMSSLGYQVIYRLWNSRAGASCERVVLPDDGAWARQHALPLLSLESGRPLGAFDVIAFSVTYDLDITGFFEMLSMAGIPVLRSERTRHHPPVLLGGPVTASNALPFGPFIDLAVIGDGEVAAPKLLEVFLEGREDWKEEAARIPGVWIPELHGDRVPATQKVTAGALPAYGQIVTPHTELSKMFLIEPSRGCPRFCKFCLVRSPESPMRETEVEAVMSRIPEHAPRVGFVGAAISEWEGIREALRQVVALGKGVGISSLRADRLDEDFVELLVRGGYRTMTVASDAPSQRMRNKVAKALRASQLRRAAELARAAGMSRLKMYVIVGLPDETPEDLEELADFSRELGAILPLALGLSPLVPKLHTPLGDAPFEGVELLERKLDRLRRALQGKADVRATSARWSWVEYRMSQGCEEAGLAALEAWRQGGSYQAWREALVRVPERGGLEAARRAALWPAAGMR